MVEISENKIVEVLKSGEIDHKLYMFISYIDLC